MNRTIYPIWFELRHANEANPLPNSRGRAAPVPGGGRDRGVDIL